MRVLLRASSLKVCITVMWDTCLLRQLWIYQSNLFGHLPASLPRGLQFNTRLMKVTKLNNSQVRKLYSTWCSVVWWKFRRSVVPLCSGSKNERSKKPAKQNSGYFACIVSFRKIETKVFGSDEMDMKTFLLFLAPKQSYPHALVCEKSTTNVTSNESTRFRKLCWYNQAQTLLHSHFFLTNWLSN
jgi:hypothetical protein